MSDGGLPGEDLVALRQLVDRYADAVDRRDRDVLVSLFTPDGVLRVQADDGPVTSEWAGPTVAESLGTIAGFDRTFHHVGGAVFRPGVGSGRATGRVHCLAHHYDRSSNGPVDLVMMIRYHDLYERAAEWHIAERRVSIQWTELHPAHPRRRAPPAGPSGR